MTRPIRLAIENDYDLVVHGVARMLAPYSDRVSVVELDINEAPRGPADIVLYDTFAADQGKKLDCVSVLKGHGAERLAVYSWNLDRTVVQHALSNGAHSYLSKELMGEQLADALERIHAGEVVVSSQDGGTSEHHPPGCDWPGRDEGLTEREAEVLCLITQGLSNQDIVERVYLSINTVKSYIRAAYQKIGVSSRSQAVLWGVDHGLALEHRREQVRIQR